MAITVFPPRDFALDRQRCRVHVYDVVTGTDRIVFETDEILLEAPNWAPEGLLLNGAGKLWSLEADADGGDISEVPLLGIPPINNDHVLVPGTGDILLSANDGQIYRAPRTGGEAVRVTNPDDPFMHFLHGVSPDAAWIAYTALSIEDGRVLSADLRTARINGSDDEPLTTGEVADGSEWAPDGSWIYLNTEQFSETPGHAQIARMHRDRSHIEQLTFDDRVNWFPHPSPTGRDAVYISFPPGTHGHPADLEVELRLVRGGRWGQPETVATVFGGQGTINVNSWTPDGSRFAYVDYPVG
ncbi:TolB family protein [Microbacterium sp. NPDC077663]|uniref:TolB family protein n=1 Tax=Microbacterium sp. NPDC077663 TaxID=3364189 RepID=UPI0037CCBAA2